MAASSSVRFPPYFHFRFGRKRYFRPPQVLPSAVRPTPNTPSVKEFFIDSVSSLFGSRVRTYMAPISNVHFFPRAKLKIVKRDLRRLWAS